MVLCMCEWMRQCGYQTLSAVHGSAQVCGLEFYEKLGHLLKECAYIEFQNAPKLFKNTFVAQTEPEPVRSVFGMTKTQGQRCMCTCLQV